MTEHQSFQSLSDYIEKAHELSKDDRYQVAFDLLDEAEDLPPDMLGLDGMEQIQRVRADLKEDREHRTLHLRRQLDAIIAKPLEEVRNEELDAGEKEYLPCLARVMPDHIEWEELNQRWQGFRQRVEEQWEIEHVEQELLNIWDSQSKLTVAKFDRARDLAFQLMQTYSDSDKALRLLERAEKEREKAYEFEDQKTTQAAEGNFEALIEAMMEGFARGVETLPWYERIEGKLTQVEGREVKPEDAIDQVMKLRTQYHNKKIQEYIDSAREELDEHPEHPKAALAIIERAKDQFQYADPKEKDRLDEIIADEIEPRIRNRELAEELALDAQRMASNDPEKAWDLLQEARSIDAFAPAIKRTEQAVLPHLKLHLEGALQDAEEKRLVGNLEAARNLASRIRKYASGAGLASIEASATELERACNNDEALLKSLQDTATQIRDIIDTDIVSAHRLLQEAQESIAGRPDHFRQPLRGAESQVQERMSAQAVLAGMQASFEILNPVSVPGFRDLSEILDKAELKEIKNIQNGLKALEQNVLQQRSRHASMGPLLNHIRGRLHLIRGRLAWRSGLYKRALEAWQDCNTLGNAEDRTLAHKWIVEARDATAVTRAMGHARFKYEKERDYAGALEVLQPWKDKPSPKQAEVWELYHTIRSGWIAQLKQEIETRKGADGQKLNAQAIIERLSKLEELDTQEAKKYVGKQVAIYRMWAQKTADIQLKIKYYKLAIKTAGEPPPTGIVKELLWAQREQFWNDLESLSRKSPEQALLALRNWIDDHPMDVVMRLEQIRRLLNAGNSTRIEIEMAEKRLEEARKENDPFKAGLSDGNAVEEAELKLQVRKEQSQAFIEMEAARQTIQEWLRPDKGIIDYHYATTKLKSTKEALSDQRKRIATVLSQHQGYQSLAPDAQARVKKEWDRVRSWLHTEAQTKGALHQWYRGTKRTLLKTLRERWHEQSPIQVDKMTLRAAPPSTELMERLRIGLRIQFLSKGEQAGRTTLSELGKLHRELNEEANLLLNDIDGPEYDLKQKPLNPVQALEKQQKWALTLKQWADDIALVYQFYRTSETSESDGGVKELAHKLDAFYGRLALLEQKKEQVLSNLDRAKRAGDITFDGHSWQDVPWRTMVKTLLSSSWATATRHKIEPGFWQQLDTEDRDQSDDAWNKAADVLYDMRLDSHIAKAPWQEMDKISRDAKIDERWQAVLDPILELTEMTGHRILKWLKTKVNKAHQTRKRLVLAATFLYALVQAERFTLDLAQMAHMEQLDGENEFGFRTGKVIKDPEPLTWDALKDKLTKQKQQWEAFHSWWKPAASSALTVWREPTTQDELSGRERLIHYVKRAEYEDAYQLAIDALYGVDAIPHVKNVYEEHRELPAKKIKEEFQAKLSALDKELQQDNPALTGKTNTLGGGLALIPLMEYLRQRPSELNQPSSRRMRRALNQVEQWLHDVKESMAEVRFWLDGVSRPARVHPDLTDPIPERQAEFIGIKEELDGAIKALHSPWTFRKKRQREYCQDLLDELKKIASEGDYEDFESWI